MVQLLFCWQTRHWSQLLNENSAADFIKLTTAFIIVRLGKGMAMSMVLLTFTLQFNHLELTYGYVALTLLYFILSQYKGMCFTVSTLKHLQSSPCGDHWAGNQFLAMETQF
jgi:hypothetical protein